VPGYADDEMMYTEMEELSKVYRLTLPDNDYNHLIIHEHDKISHEYPQKAESMTQSAYALTSIETRKIKETKRNENGTVINNQLYKYKNMNQSVCL